MSLRAFRDGVAIGTIRPAGDPKPHEPTPMVSRSVELDTDDRSAWDHEGACYELEDGRGQRIEVTPQRGKLLVFDRNDEAKAMFTVLYNDLAPFDWG